MKTQTISVDVTIPKSDETFPKGLTLDDLTVFLSECRLANLPGGTEVFAGNRHDQPFHFSTVYHLHASRKDEI